MKSLVVFRHLKRSHDLIFNMNKIILVLCAVLAVAKGNVDSVNSVSYPKNFATRTNDYMNMHQRQFVKILEDYDTKLKHSRGLYPTRTEAIKVQLEMVIASIIHIEQRLNPLKVLNDYSKQCIMAYSSKIPTVMNTRTAITRCISATSSEYDILFRNALNTRNALQIYYTNYFTKGIANCGKRYDTTTTNYTHCVTSVTNDASTYTIDNQKTFDSQIEIAECSAKAIIKRALDCSYTVQTRTIAQITETDVLINKCLDPNDKCEPCNTCETIMEISGDLIKNRTMLNPFYDRKEHLGCLTLSVK